MPMTDAKVIKATYSEIKMVKTRKVGQLVLEFPLEKFAEVVQRLGVPMPDAERWVAVALELVASKTEQQHKAKDLSRSMVGKERYANSSAMEKARTRATLLAKDPQFQMWSGQRTEDAAATFIRLACGVESRRDIATDQNAYEYFLRLEAEFAEATGRMAENRG